MSHLASCRKLGSAERNEIAKRCRNQEASFERIGHPSRDLEALASVPHDSVRSFSLRHLVYHNFASYRVYERGVLVDFGFKLLTLMKGLQSISWITEVIVYGCLAFLVLFGISILFVERKCRVFPSHLFFRYLLVASLSLFASEHTR
jgi:hypothetical protein